MGEAVGGNRTLEDDKAVHPEKQPSRSQASLDSAVEGLLLTNRILPSRIEITHSTNLQTQELMTCLRSQEMR